MRSNFVPAKTFLSIKKRFEFLGTKGLVIFWGKHVNFQIFDITTNKPAFALTSEKFCFCELVQKKTKIFESLKVTIYFWDNHSPPEPSFCELKCRPPQTSSESQPKPNFNIKLSMSLLTILVSSWAGVVSWRNSIVSSRSSDIFNRGITFEINIASTLSYLKK